MAVVDATVFYWTAKGMQMSQPHAHSIGYIQVVEVERLLEEAHQRGRRQIEDGELRRGMPGHKDNDMGM